MTNEQIEELQKLAEAATPGPWLAFRQTDDECNFAGYSIEAVSKVISDDGTAPDSNDACFIAAANPAAIKELLSELKRTEFERAAAREAMQSMSAELTTLRAAASAPKAELPALPEPWQKDLSAPPGSQNHYAEDQMYEYAKAYVRAVLAQAAPVAALWQAAEKLAQSWDGVESDEAADVGATIRHDFAMYAKEFGAAPAAPVAASNLLEDIYRWLSRARFDSPADESRAASFGVRIKEALAAPVAAAAPAGWVSVDERRPTDHTKKYLVFSNWGIRMAHLHEPVWADGVFQDTASNSDEGMSEWDQEKGPFTVTHWCELLAAPAQETAS